MTRAPYLDEVLPLVRPDRNVRLRLSEEQKRALLRARAEAADPNWRGTSFPVTPFAFQAVARKLGEGHVGIKRSRAAIHRGKGCDLLLDAGTFKARRPTRLIPVYRLGAASLAWGGCRESVGYGFRRVSLLGAGAGASSAGNPPARGPTSSLEHMMCDLSLGYPPCERRRAVRAMRRMRSGDQRWAERGWRDPD